MTSGLVSQSASNVIQGDEAADGVLVGIQQGRGEKRVEVLAGGEIEQPVERVFFGLAGEFGNAAALHRSIGGGRHFGDADPAPVAVEDAEPALVLELGFHRGAKCRVGVNPGHGVRIGFHHRVPGGVTLHQVRIA